MSLETSGALDVAAVDPRVRKVVDLKCPGSGEMARNRYENLAHLTPHDQLKFVIADRADYEWAREQCLTRSLPALCQVLFSPVADTLTPVTLVEWILADRLPVRFQLQLHKVLWGNTAGKMRQPGRWCGVVVAAARAIERAPPAIRWPCLAAISNTGKKCPTPSSCSRVD